MKRILMSALLLLVLAMSGCFLLTGNDPEIEYVVTHNSSDLPVISITYIDDDFELREVQLISNYWRTAFTVPPTEDFLSFVQADGSIVANPYTLQVQIYVDGYYRRTASSGLSMNPVASAAYLLNK